MEEPDHQHQLWRTPDVLKDWPKCLPVDSVKSFSQVNEYWVEGLVLLNALLLKLSHSKYHVYSASSRPEAALCLREGLFGDCDESVKDDLHKNLSCNWEEGNAPVVPAVRLTSLILIERDHRGIAEVIWHHLLLPGGEQDIVEGPKGIVARCLVELSRDAILSWCSAGDCLVDCLLDLLDGRGFCKRNSYGLLEDLIQGAWVNWRGPIQQNAEVLLPALAEILLVLDEPLPIWRQLWGAARGRGAKNGFQWVENFFSVVSVSIVLDFSFFVPPPLVLHCLEISLDFGLEGLKLLALRDEGRVIQPLYVRLVLGMYGFFDLFVGINIK